jgi:2-(1,2-epoxy-1,2-dihydrophenyl)acetyl-CoA isomerase
MTVESDRSVPGLTVAQRGAVLTLRLERPEQRNAIDDVMMTGLIEAIDLAGRDESVRAILLTGAGEHFCGGADVIARNADTGSRPRAGSIQRRLPSLAHRLIPLLCEVQVPVVCAVKGWAVGIGLQLAAAADFTVTSTDATFWAPFSERGFSPDSGATWLLPRLVGLARARELLLLGRRINGDEAAAWGLVHQSVPREDVDSVAEELVDRLAAGPTVSLGLTKWLLLSGDALPLDGHLRNEAFALEISSRSEDFREGLGALKERRNPEFKGR